jgi:hypothetical protein
MRCRHAFVAVSIRFAHTTSFRSIGEDCEQVVADSPRIVIAPLSRPADDSLVRCDGGLGVDTVARRDLNVARRLERCSGRRPLA